jgi:hypothetical protein
MKKSIILLIIATAGLFSCKQGSKLTPETVETETINSVRKYEYTDSMGKRLIILNSFRKGGPYTDPKGISYGKVIFWTRLINETDNPLELKIDFPVDSFEVPGLPGKYYKLLVPPDGAPFRTGLSIKGQNLVYRISRYESRPAGLIVYEKEINCGSINLKKLVLQK